jgi:hypothetical protein
MSTSREEATSNGRSTPQFDTNIQGNVQQLIQIAQVQGSVNLFSQAVIDKLLEAIAEQGRRVDNTLQMRETVAHTFALLRSKNALYADLEDEVWKCVFKSLRELCDALAQENNKLHMEEIDALRQVMEAVYQQHLTFREEQRAASGPVVEGTIDVESIAGEAVGVEAKIILSGRIDGRISAKQVEGTLYGVKVDQVGG